MQKRQLSVDEKNKKLQKKLEEILPESIKDEGNKALFGIFTFFDGGFRNLACCYLIKSLSSNLPKWKILECDGNEKKVMRNYKQIFLN
jgi:hypothetical protein